MRTADIVPSVQVLMTQVWALSQADNLSEEEKLQEGDLKGLFRFGVEEIMRRSQKQDAQPMSRVEALEAIDPEYKNFLEPVIRKAKEAALLMAKTHSPSTQRQQRGSDL